MTLAYSVELVCIIAAGIILADFVLVVVGRRKAL